MGTNSEVPLTHRLERRHLLNAVRVEVLELKPILEQHPADESPSKDGETALVEGHEQHHESLWGRDIDSSPRTFHFTAAVNGGSWPSSMRRRSCSRDTFECVPFDIAVAESRAG
jgi:hypothetical protein